jgi:outer membrane immunogenic protein
MSLSAGSLAAVIVLIAGASVATAADIGRSATPSLTYPINWSGAYAGADIGGGWSSDNVNYYTGDGFPPYARIDTAKVDGSGLLGGVFAGYNYQLNNAIVAGVEGDFEGTSIGGKNHCMIVTTSGTPYCPPSSGAQSTSDALPWQGSLRGRLGYAAGNALIYATGGLAFAQINTGYAGEVAPGTGSDSFSRTRAGWTLGTGVDYALNSNWVVRAEYRYSSFGSIKDTMINAPLGAVSATAGHAGVDENAVRIGIAYKFDAPASTAR